MCHSPWTSGKGQGFFLLAGSADREPRVSSWIPTGRLSDVYCEASSVPRFSLPGSRQFGSGCHRAGVRGGLENWMEALCLRPHPGGSGGLSCSCPRSG